MNIGPTGKIGAYPSSLGSQDSLVLRGTRCEVGDVEAFPVFDPWTWQS